MADTNTTMCFPSMLCAERSGNDLGLINRNCESTQSKSKMSAYSFILYTFILGFLHISASLGIQSFKIDTKIAISTVDKRFLSIAIDTNLLRHDWRGLKVCDKLTTLTKGLQPAYLRIGGTAADFLTFDNKASNPTVSHEEEALFDDPIEDYFSEMNFTITRSDLDKTHEIASNAGWDVVFDLNVLKRRKNGSWDPTNPLEIMRYVRDKGYHFAWQLGNGILNFFYFFFSSYSFIHLALIHLVHSFIFIFLHDLLKINSLMR